MRQLSLFEKEPLEKIYQGRRVRLGRAIVTVDGQPLVPRLYHSPDGFEWGDGGRGPLDLARSILWNHLGHEPPASLYRQFKFDVIAKFAEEDWRLSSEQIRLWLKQKERT